MVARHVSYQCYCLLKYILSQNKPPKRLHPITFLTSFQLIQSCSSHSWISFYNPLPHSSNYAKLLRRQRCSSNMHTFTFTRTVFVRPKTDVLWLWSCLQCICFRYSFSCLKATAQYDCGNTTTADVNTFAGNKQLNRMERDGNSHSTD